MTGVDMHVHTTASDGLLTAAELIDIGMKQSLNGMAVSDHDTVAAIAGAVAYAKNKPFLVVPAIEISSEWQDREIHILGYGIDYENQYLLNKLEFLREERRLRLERILAKLNEYGIILAKDKLKAGGANAIGRAHIARLMVEEGYAETVTEVFSAWLSRGGKAYVPRSKLEPGEAISLIQRAGGVAVMAHPGLAQADSYIPQMIEMGLGGLEIHHPNHTLADVIHYEKLADQYGIFKTGGSDCHSDRLGTITTPSAIVKAILTKEKRMKS